MNLIKFICILIMAFIVNVRAWTTVARRVTETYIPFEDGWICENIVLKRLHIPYYKMHEIRLVYNVHPILHQTVNIEFLGPDKNDKKPFWFQNTVPVNQTIDVYQGIIIPGERFHLCFSFNVENGKYGVPQTIEWSIWD